MIDDFAYPTTESRLITFQIGAICVNWAQIDSSLGVILGRYLKVAPEHVHIATSIVDLSRKCELIKALSFISDEKKIYQKLEKVLNFLDNQLRPLRNRYAHDSYSFFTGDHIRKVFKTQVVSIQAFQKELKTNREELVTSDELSTFNKDLDVCAMFIAYHTVRMIADPKKIDPKFLNALTHTGDEAYGEVEATMARYRSSAKTS